MTSLPPASTIAIQEATIHRPISAFQMAIISGTGTAVLVLIFALIVWLFNWVTRVDRKRDVRLKYSGVDLGRHANREAQALRNAGNNIEAIRVYWRLTRVSLAEAKVVIEKPQ
jgi:hypothetical protein